MRRSHAVVGDSQKVSIDQKHRRGKVLRAEMPQVYIDIGQCRPVYISPDDDVKLLIWLHVVNDVVFSVTINLH